MNETFATDSLLLTTYERVFELLMKLLLVSVIFLFVAAVILIILCCWETVAAARKKGQQVGLDNPYPPSLTAGCGVRWLDTAFSSWRFCTVAAWRACTGAAQPSVGKNRKRRRAVALQSPRHVSR